MSLTALHLIDKQRLLRALKSADSNGLCRYSQRPGAILGLRENSIWVSTRSALEVIQIEIWIQDLLFFFLQALCGGISTRVDISPYFTPESSRTTLDHPC